MRKRILIAILRLVGVALLFLGVGANAQMNLIWERQGAGPASRYGGTIFALGDRNQDGYDDFAVTAWGSGEYGNQSEARIELFYGGNPPSDEPFFVFIGIPEGQFTQWGGYEIGDINCDGLMDWLVAYRNHDFSVRMSHVYIGATELPTNPTWIISYYDSLQDMFVTPQRIGDFNGDGCDDLYLHGHGDSGSDPHHGSIWFGSEVPDSIPDWEIQGLGYFAWPSGSALEDGVGDLNGDGYDDILNLNSHNHGPFEVFWGSAFPDTIPDTIGFNPHNGYAHMVSDLNGDSRDDIAFDVSINRTEVFFGGDTLSLQADYEIQHNGCGSDEGGIWKVDAVGDLNGDGFNELAVTNAWCHGGTIWLYFNRNWLNPGPRMTMTGWSFGTSGLREAAYVGDVNGDGIDDLAIGAFNDVNFRGWAAILAGNPGIQVDTDYDSPLMNAQLEVWSVPHFLDNQLCSGRWGVGG